MENLDVIDSVIRAASYVVLYATLFLLSKWFKDILTPYKMDEELTKNDNVAVALAVSGYFFATGLIFVATLFGPSRGLMNDLVSVGGYSLLGLVLLNLSRLFNDKVLLHKFCNNTQLVQQQNASVGVVQMGSYIATGLIIAGALTGQGSGPITTCVFFVLGQLALLLFARIYARLIPYNIHDELEQNNGAASVAFGGSLVALGIIISNSVAGNFAGWGDSIASFAMASVLAFLFLPLVRVFMDRLVLPGANLSDEIREFNLGAGFLEAVVAIIFATILAFVI